MDLSLSKLAALRAVGHRFEHTVFAEQGHNNMSVAFDAAIQWISEFKGSPDP